MYIYMELFGGGMLVKWYQKQYFLLSILHNFWHSGSATVVPRSAVNIKRSPKIEIVKIAMVS